MSSKTDPPTGEPSAKRGRIAPTPNITDLLPYDVLRDLFRKFLGPGHHRYVAATCRVFRHAYESGTPSQQGQKTTYESAAASVPCAEICHVESENIEDIALAAARRGRTQVLEWACNRGYVSDYCLFYEAARCGQVQVFEWAVAKGLTCEFRIAAGGAASAGHVQVLEWMWEHGAKRQIFNDCAFHATLRGRVSVFEWLKRHGIPVKNVDVNAAAGGHVHVLDWLLNNGYSLFLGFVDCAARYGNIPALQWARDHHIRWSSKTCAAAAYGGHINTLKWLRRNGCSWDGNVIYWAQNRCHSNIVEWARKNGCPTEAEQIYSSLEFR